MTPKCIIPVILAILAAADASAVTLRWDIPLNDRLEIVRTAEVRFLENDRVAKVYEERNIIDLTCYKKRDAANQVKGLFSVYRRSSGEDVFQLNEQYPADFIIEENGRFRVDAQYYMPNLRHVPTFPNRDLREGESWTANAELVLNNFSRPFKLTFPVNYRLMKIETEKGKSEAAINYNFLINMNLTGGVYPSDFPLKIIGKNEGTILWDINNKRPLSIKEKYRIIFIFRTGASSYGSNEFQMYIETKNRLYSAVTPDEKELQKKELEKDIPEDSGIDVDTDKRGLVLRLGDVLFDFDSSDIREDARGKLDKIVDILKRRYPDREIIVEGHTDNIGEKRYNRRLSQDRANSVAGYLKSRTGNDKLSYRGFGDDRPIADNSTGEGRQKNRRVEIIIKLH